MINIGIIGAGRIGKVHAESITKYVQGAAVAALADPVSSSETVEWARSMGIGGILPDYKEIIDDPAIDAVLICSPTDVHSSMSLEALEAGKHVFCEKPIDTDLSRICAVIEKVRQTGLKFQVGFNRRFDHNFRSLKKAVADGKIGQIHMVKVTSRDPAPPPAEYVKRSGGMFMDMTIHDFDMVRYLSGSDIQEVFASAAVLIDPAIGLAGDVDTAILSMKLANGALAVIDNSRRAAYGYDQRAEVFGSSGCASIGHDTPSTLVLSGENGIVTEKPLYFFLERYMQSFVQELREFIEAIERDTEPPVTALDGLKPVVAAVAARKSLEEGRPVRLSEITH